MQIPRYKRQLSKSKLFSLTPQRSLQEESTNSVTPLRRSFARDIKQHLEEEEIKLHSCQHETNIP
jgi:hypothetical protein